MEIIIVEPILAHRSWVPTSYIAKSSIWPTIYPTVDPTNQPTIYPTYIPTYDLTKNQSESTYNPNLSTTIDF